MLRPGVQLSEEKFGFNLNKKKSRCVGVILKNHQKEAVVSYECNCWHYILRRRKTSALALALCKWSDWHLLEVSVHNNISKIITSVMLY